MKNLPSDTYYFSEKKQGPTVVILGATHGNEKIGVKIIENLKKSLKKDGIFGEIYLIIGNPKAYKQNLRFIDYDLNRLFGKKFSKLTNKSLLIEEKRALEIAPILAKANYVLDIHSTIKKSTPFIYTKDSPSHIALAKIFGTKYIVSSSPSCKTENLHSSIDNFTDRHGGIGITYESGWHKDNSKFNEQLNKAKQFLKYTGSAFINYSLHFSKNKLLHLFIYKEIIPQTQKFTLSKDYQNFDILKKGEKLATDGNKEIVVTQDSYIIFPKINIQIRKPACYLAHQKNLTP